MGNDCRSARISGMPADPKFAQPIQIHAPIASNTLALRESELLAEVVRLRTVVSRFSLRHRDSRREVVWVVIGVDSRIECRGFSIPRMDVIQLTDWLASWLSRGKKDSRGNRRAK